MKVKRHASPVGLRYLFDWATKNKTVAFFYAWGIILQILVIKFGYKGFLEVYNDKRVPLAGVIIKHNEQNVYQNHEVNHEYRLWMKFDSIGYQDIKVDKESYNFKDGQRVVFNLSHLDYLPSKNVKGWYVSCVVVLFLEFAFFAIAGFVISIIFFIFLFRDGIPGFIDTYKEYRLNKRLRHRRY